MLEGKLCASPNPGSYAVSSPYNPDLTTGQAVELLLGGHWIPGHIAYSDHLSDSSNETLTQSIGAYQLPSDDVEDIVTEASEESFPASDPPSWTADPDRAPQRKVSIVNGYYFIADTDNSVCGLCIGMQLRIKGASIK